MLMPFVIPVVGFILQAYPRFFNRNFGVDVWTRLIEIDHIRKNNHSIPGRIKDQFIIDGYFDYPPIFPMLLSYFPRRCLNSLQGMVAPLIDSVQVLLVYFVAYFLTKDHALSMTSQAVYALTPVIAIENSYLTPRSLGYLNFSLAVLPLLISIYYGGWYFIVIGFFFTTLLFLTHRFAMQSFLFISIFFTYFLNTPLFAQVFLGAFVSALLITKGYYLRVLKGHCFNIYFWIKNLDFRYSHQVRGIIKKDTKTDFVNKSYLLLTLFSPLTIFGLNPWAFSGFAFLVLAYFQLLEAPIVFVTFASWIIFFYFFGVVVMKTRRLMPIGEGYRYMEFATVPSSILSAYILFSLAKIWPVWIVAIGAGLLGLMNLTVIIYMQVKTIIKDKNRSLTNEWAKMYEYINTQVVPPRIICVPHQNTTMTVYNTHAKVLVNADNPGLMKLGGIYPVLTTPISELARKYELTHALVNIEFASLKELGLENNKIERSVEHLQLVKIG
jgi:hypothetical protein